MAVCEIRPVHVTPAKTLEYVTRPDKSQEGALVFCNRCSDDWKLAALQMQAHRERFGKDNKILAHHGYVSFPGAEISAEQALEVANEFMQGFFKDYQYLGSVHVDTDNIHFNFVINSVGLDGKKYLGCKDTQREVRAWVDTCCERYGLSVVIPKGKGMSYKEWKEEKEGNSWKATIKEDIDKVINKAGSFEHFIKMMKEEGYYIKHGDNVKHIVFKKQGMERGARGKTLGARYTEKAINERIKLKEFNFVPSSVKLRKPKKNLRLIEREMRRLYYRHAEMSTNVALGIHVLNSYITGRKMKIETFPKYKQNRIMAEAKKEIKHLERQLQFIENNGLKHRQGINDKVHLLNEKLGFLNQELERLHKETSIKKRNENKNDITRLKNEAKEVEKELNQYYDLEFTLDKIKGKRITENVSKEMQRENETNDKER